MILRINKTGSFIVEGSQFFESQCGFVGNKLYKFDVTVEAIDERLTPEGFVMDRILVNEYFDERYCVKKDTCHSCEIMAREAVEHFKAILNQTNISWTKVVVRLMGDENGFVEAESQFNMFKK